MICARAPEVFSTFQLGVHASQHDVRRHEVRLGLDDLFE